MGVLFIIIQPVFGMETLTSRHAQMYQQLGHWSSGAAVAIAWIAHMSVSVIYGFLSGIVVLRSTRLPIVALFTLVFSWLTTLLAPPANAIIVQLVSFQEINAGGLPGMNFSLDAKFMLHLMFFAAIGAALHAYRKHLSV
ncbi:hypothetical protein [Dokdonella sp.]|uniref:hypothetical protein n=1 Tax=Dokdonella sp. TaxID=2291710 RepID=UPI003C6FED3C